ncbi:MAG: group II intron reverse transcriptase/maturase [Phycisphaerae bacterium]
MASRLDRSHPRDTLAEQAEGRGPAKGNSLRGRRDRTQCRAPLQAALERIRRAASRDKTLRLTALWHHVYDVERLREEYFALKRSAAPGVDGQTWWQYGQNLESNLQELSGRLKRGAYRARPVKRAWIPKADGRRRPIGIPALEDKIVQRAAASVLGAVYEGDFMGFSYGFRPGRGAHDALDALSVGITRCKISWVLDADIRGFFDAIDHEWLVKFVEHRIADRRVIRHIKKWLRAGVLEDGKRAQVEQGTPQGGSISPLLANVYLHYVFDLWVHQWRQREARGDVIVVRYADDIVMGFQHRSDAERFLGELGQRFARFNLELHPDKTRLIEFGRFAAERRRRRGEHKPETFDFLGFTHACSRTRKGRFAVLRYPIKRQMRAKLKAIKAELWRRMHRPVAETGRWLQSVVSGWLRYYAVPRTYRWLQRFRRHVMWLWWRTLRRRGDKRKSNWPQVYRLADRWLPVPRIWHPYPEQRLAVRTQGRSPVR